MKRLALFISVILIAGALLSCSPATTVTVANEQLNLVKVDMSDKYAGIVPSQGNQILAVKFLAQSETPDLTKISDAFFGQTPCTLSSGSASYPCKSIAYEKSGGKIIVVLVFDVPSDLRKTTSKLTLSGSAFQTIDMTL